MKMRVSFTILLIILLFATLISCNINDKAPSSSLLSSNISETDLEPDVTQELETTVEIEDIITDGNQFVYESHLLDNSKLLLLYSNGDVTSQFKIYDLQTKQIYSESETGLFSSYVMLRDLRLLDDKFFFLTIDTCFVFDYKCDIVKELKLPFDYFDMPQRVITFTDDLSIMAYPDYDSTGDHQYLYLYDFESEETKIVRELDPWQGKEVSLIEQMFFNEDHSMLLYKGLTSPTPETSVQSFGTINLADGKNVNIVQDRIDVHYRNNKMAIFDTNFDYGEARTGTIHILDGYTSEVEDIKTVNCDETELVRLSDNPDYIITLMVLNENDYTAIYSLYYQGDLKNTYTKTFESEIDFFGATSSDYWFGYDVETEQLVISYWSDTHDKYIIELVSL